MDKLVAKEIFRRYTNTYAQCYHKPDKTLLSVYFTDFGFDAVDVPFASIHSLSVGKASQQLVIPLKDLEILPMPDRRVFDFSGKTLVYTRVPNRQWRKGLCTENASIRNVSFDLLLDVPNNNEFEFVRTSDNKVWNLSVLHALFNPEYSNDFYKAVNTIENPEETVLSVSINDKYWISAHTSQELPYLLYRYDNPVAYYNNKSDTFILLDKIYLQEITDFCSRFNLTSKIEV